MKKTWCKCLSYLDTEHMNTGSRQFWRKVHVVINVVFGLVWIGHVSSVRYGSFDDSTRLASCLNTQLMNRKEKAVKVWGRTTPLAVTVHVQGYYFKRQISHLVVVPKINEKFFAVLIDFGELIPQVKPLAFVSPLTVVRSHQLYSARSHRFPCVFVEDKPA